MEGFIMIDIKDNKIVDINDLQANSYNPNKMPKTEMDLLKDCIAKYGFLFPIITTWDNDLQKYRIIDGYHRYETLNRMGADKVSIIDLAIPYEEAVQLTVLMNRIKGVHQVQAMSDLVVKLTNLGLSDYDICKNLGMEAEELIRLKQQLGIASVFADVEYSKSWVVK